MAEFGWAFIDCDETSGGGQAAGPTGSLQFLTGSNATSGSSNLTFLTSSNTLNLTGTLNVSGTINANEINIDVENRTVVNIEVSGSTKFGDTIDDVHQFTGSLRVTGGVSFNYYTVEAADHPYSILTTDYILGVSSSNYVSLTLPAANAVPKGTIYIIKDEWGGFNTGSGGGRPAVDLIAVSASGTDLIDGNGNYEIKDGNNAAISLYSNGSNGWFVF